MIDSDDATRFAARESALSEDVKRGVSDPFLGSPCLLARTTTVKTYPTTPKCYYACLPLTLLGTESEGGVGLLTPTDAPFFALNLGNSIPASGTNVVTTFVGTRWIFRHDA